MVIRRQSRLVGVVVVSDGGDGDDDSGVPMMCKVMHIQWTAMVMLLCESQANLAA